MSSSIFTHDISLTTVWRPNVRGTPSSRCPGRGRGGGWCRRAARRRAARHRCSRRLECPSAARRASATRRDEAEHDVVAGSDGGDTLADLHDDAGSLVSADQRRDGGQIPGAGVVIGVAHARGDHLDEHLAGLGRVELDLLDAPLAAWLPEDGCFGLHVFPLLGRWPGRAAWTACRIGTTRTCSGNQPASAPSPAPAGRRTDHFERQVVAAAGGGRSELGGAVDHQRSRARRAARRRSRTGSHRRR